MIISPYPQIKSHPEPTVWVACAWHNPRYFRFYAVSFRKLFFREMLSCQELDLSFYRESSAETKAVFFVLFVSFMVIKQFVF